MSKFLEFINQDKPVLIDFFATWCGPCQTMSPILKQVKDDLGESVKILKIDVDKNKALANKFQVRGVPTFIIFNKGKQVWKQSGLIKKSDLKHIILKNQN